MIPLLRRSQGIFCALLFLGFSYFIAGFTVDDAFISFRYAYNLVHYGIWNWNPDHDRVEAYTSPLYTALAIIPIGLGIPVKIFFKAIGLALFGWLLWRIRSFSADRSLRFAYTVFILANWYVYVHIYSCLETPLFIILCLEVFLFLLKDGQDPRRFYCLLLLLSLTRPDGALVSILAMLAYAHRMRWKIPHVLFLSALATAGVIYFIWRYEYFGYLLPNTFYAKLLPELDGTTIVARLLGIWTYLIILGVLAAWVKDKRFTLIAVLSIIVYSIAYIPSNLWMNYADRFALQLFLPVIVLSACYVQHFPAKRRNEIIALLFLSLIPNYDFQDIKTFLTCPYFYTNGIQDLGKRLAKFNNKGYSLMLGDIGNIPYYSSWKTYDLVGLANTTISHYGNSTAYMKTIHPDLIVLYATGEKAASIRLNDYQQSVIYAFIQSSGNYEPIGASMMRSDAYYHFFLKKTIPDFKAIKQVILENEQLTKRMNNRSLWDMSGFHFSYLM